MSKHRAKRRIMGDVKTPTVLLAMLSAGAVATVGIIGVGESAGSSTVAGSTVLRGPASVVLSPATPLARAVASAAETALARNAGAPTADRGESAQAGRRTTGSLATRRTDRAEPSTPGVPPAAEAPAVPG
ncbi:MAG: hypothetical protein M3Q27_17505, partial [Actinomycetota bacterium]|nr:hypothetical protein [Actinomycetota bacterium]